jgi:ATP-dependent DNA helicase 2 subunit 2
MPLEDSYNPLIHRVNQAVKDRAVNPNSPIPPTPPILLQLMHPPEDLTKTAKPQAETLIRAAEVKKVPPKAKGKRQRETIKPISGLDVDALLGGNKSAVKITKENAIPGFRRAISVSEEVSEIEDAAKQMGEIVRELISDSFGDSLYARATEDMGVMREELINMEEPGYYNAFVRDLKKRLLSGELGGDRREMWWQIRVSRLGLIDKAQSEVSRITKEEADEVCHLPRKKCSIPTNTVTSSTNHDNMFHAEVSIRMLCKTGKELFIYVCHGTVRPSVSIMTGKR